jgi:argonaute-like protein implicated in RNA metabolism and viral defense
MTTEYLSGETLQPPKLRFNASSPQAQHDNARQGLRRYGPYDAQRLAKDRVQCAIIYPRSLSHVKNTIVDGLVKGNGQFAGFRSLFRIPLEFAWERAIETESEGTVKEAVTAINRDHRPDICVLVTSDRNETLYSSAKAILLGIGIPNQVVRAETIRNSRGLPWSLENIALQIYAKTGGTPWTVMSSLGSRELVIGVSRALDRNRNMVVGFITLFTHDGDYQLLYSLAPRPINWENLDEYRDALAQLIVEAYQEYSKHQGAPDKLIIHLCKRPGNFREVAAVEQAMEALGKNLPFALVHLNDDTSYRLFDTDHPTYVPQPGIKVDLNRYTALLFLDGRVPDGTGQEIRRKRGVPRILEVYLDRRSTIGADECPRLVQQVFDFARVNWRGFNAQAIPATLNYSYLVARLVSEIGANNWNAIASSVSLRDKAWFL